MPVEIGIVRGPPKHREYFHRASAPRFPLYIWLLGHMPQGGAMPAQGETTPEPRASAFAPVRPRIAIVDDHTLLVEAFTKLLETDCDVVGTYGDPRAFLLDVPSLRCDVVILDISMPLLNGLDTARELRRLAPSVKIIF